MRPAAALTRPRPVLREGHLIWEQAVRDVLGGEEKGVSRAASDTFGQELPLSELSLPSVKCTVIIPASRGRRRDRGKPCPWLPGVVSLKPSVEGNHYYYSLTSGQGPSTGYT